MSVRRWIVPSVGAAIWLVVFLGLCLSDHRLVLINADGDPALHWRIGNWMIEHHEVLRSEQFSHTRFGAPLISKEWLGEITFAAASNALGWNGAVLLAALLIATTLWLLHRWLLSEGCELLLATGLVLLAATASQHHWLARPHLATHLLAVVFAWRLRAFDRDRISSTQLFALLVPAMLLWANIHGAFFTGFVLIAVYVAGNLTRPGKARAFIMLGIACLLASLVNPNGWHLHAHVLQFLRDPVVAKFANEFRSPDFHSGAMRGFLLQLLLAGVLLLVAKPRLRATEVWMIVAWGYLALHAVRNVPVFAIVVTPILAEHWNAFLTGSDDNSPMRAYRRISANVSALNILAGGGVLVVVAIAGVVWAQARGSIATSILADRFPVKAVEWLRRHPDAVRGEMFNAYGWGGYLMLELPERKVFVDGRNDFYGPDLMTEFKKVDNTEPDWDSVLAKYGVRWTILPAMHRFNTVLSLDAGWQRVYSDETTTIYAKTTSP